MRRLFEDGAYLNIVPDKFTFAVFLFNDIIASGVRCSLTFLSQVQRLFEGGAYSSKYGRLQSENRLGIQKIILEIVKNI